MTPDECVRQGRHQGHEGYNVEPVVESDTEVGDRFARYYSMPREAMNGASGCQAERAETRDQSTRRCCRRG